MESDEKEIDAIHEQDLESVLKKLGFYEQMIQGILKCKFCGSQITMENLHSILPHSSGFSFICDKPECVQKLVEYLEEKNKTKLG
jgi:hypothetical protein